MTISVCITTYGDDVWEDLAWSRAYPSTIDQGADEVLVRHWPDLSIGPARNATAAEATGDFLIFLDADDELEDGYVEQMRMASAVATAFGGEQMVLYQPAVRYVRKANLRVNPLMLPVKDLRTDNFLVIGTMVSRDLFLRVGGFGDYPHGFEDWAGWARCWKAGATVTQVPQAIYRAYVNPRSAHRLMWRNRKYQVETHLRVQAELFPEGIA